MSREAAGWRGRWLRVCGSDDPAGVLADLGEECGHNCDDDPKDCKDGSCRWDRVKAGGTCPDKVCCVYSNKDVGERCDLPEGAGDGMCDTNGACIARNP